MIRQSLRQVFGIVLLIALAFGLRAARPALATQETTIARGNILTWRGGGANNDWSNPANWQNGIVPRLYDIVRIPAGSPDALIDSNFDGIVGGIITEEGYHGTLTIARPLTVRGDLHLAGGMLASGTVPLIVEGRATVTGGVLTTPGNIMSVTGLEIDAPGVVVMGAHGKLNLTGDGTPLTGAGLLDTTTNTPNSIEYTGRSSTDLTAAGPVTALQWFTNVGRRPGDRPQHLNGREALPLAPTTFTRTNSLPLSTGENDLTAAVIDSAHGFAYFGTFTAPAKVVKVNLSTFSRVGVLTLNTGEDNLTSAVIDTANGFAYFGTYTAPGIVVKVNLSTFMRVGARPLLAGEDYPYSAVIDTANDAAYFGTSTAPGRVVKIKLSDLTRVNSVLFNPGEDHLRCAVIDTANGFAYFGTLNSPGIVVKVDLSTFQRVGPLSLNTGENYIRSAVIDTANGFAYFGTLNSPGIVVKVNLSTFTRVGPLALNTGENILISAVIDTANGFAYFGTNLTYPGIVVKLNLSNFTRAGALTLNPGENILTSAVMDASNIFAYFGTSTSPGIVVKLNVTTANLVPRLYLPLVIR